MILQKTERMNFSRLSNSSFVGNLDENVRSVIMRYLNISSEYRYALREMSAKLENLDDFCENHYDHNPIHHMESRLKTPESIIEKMRRRKYDFTFESLQKNIYDIAGIRVVCNYINDIYQIVSLLERQKDLTILIKKDYIVNPKETGYRSLHLVVCMDLYLENEIKKIPVEIQFRSLAMDMWACLEHELRYKSKNNLTEEQKKNLKKYSDDLYKVDLNMQRIYISTAVGDDDDD